MAGRAQTIYQALDSLQSEFDHEADGVTDPSGLEALRIKYLGRKGILAQQFRQLGQLTPEDRPRVGERLNALKQHIQTRLTEIEQRFKVRPAAEEEIDLTLPGRPYLLGKKHPLLQVLDDIKRIFSDMGFSIETGPEVETDYYNFEALNIPPDHPSRDLQDTFYLEGDYLLRTHTSPVQVRTMESRQPPIRMIAPGRCFRKDTPDATHSPIFHQIEGLVVDEGVSFADLKGVIHVFAKKLFGKEVRIRFRPSFFPFTEPSAEYDISCVICDGAGCRVCKGSGWLEISGAGMVDPAVFGFVDYDSERYTGYAFGMGAERLAMLKYQIEDIRTFYENDLRFLEQF